MRDNILSVKGSVVLLSYVTRGDQEAGERVEGTFTGDVDAWGKFTFCPLGEPSIYLFEDEVTRIEVLAPITIDEDEEQAGVYTVITIDGHVSSCGPSAEDLIALAGCFTREPITSLEAARQVLSYASAYGEAGVDRTGWFTKEPKIFERN